MEKNATHRRLQEQKMTKNTFKNVATDSTKKTKYNRISGTKSQKKHLKKRYNRPGEKRWIVNTGDFRNGNCLKKHTQQKKRNTTVFQERNLKKNILKSVTTDLGKHAEHRRFQERKLFKKTHSTKKAKYSRISGTKSKKKTS